MIGDDLTPFFQVGEFAQTVTVGGVNVAAVFDSDYSTEFDIGGTTPALTLATASVPSVMQGTAVVVGGAPFSVVEVKPDGTGKTVLRLREA